MGIIKKTVKLMLIPENRLRRIFGKINCKIIVYFSWEEQKICFEKARFAKPSNYFYSKRIILASLILRFLKFNVRKAQRCCSIKPFRFVFFNP